MYLFFGFSCINFSYCSVYSVNVHDFKKRTMSYLIINLLAIFLLFLYVKCKVLVLLRYEWYQTETHVVVSVLVKNVKKDDIKCNVQESSVSFSENCLFIWLNI